MRRTLVLSVTLVLAATALTGCTLFGGEEPTPTTTTVTPTPTPETTPTPTTTTPTAPTVTSNAFSVEANIPTQIETDRTFSFVVYVNGSPSVSSDHIGAHFSSNSSTSPSTTTYERACDHASGTLPGNFTVTCRIAADGTYHMRGHARYTANGVTTDFWGPERTIKVRNFTLTATNMPAQAAANVSFTFKLNVTGNETIESDHIGAHWSWNSSAAIAPPTTAVYERTCVHQAGSVPGIFDVTCTIPAGGLTPTKAYVRGHMRLTSGEFQTNFWTQEFEVTVLPGL